MREKINLEFAEAQEFLRYGFANKITAKGSGAFEIASLLKNVKICKPFAFSDYHLFEVLL